MNATEASLPKLNLSRTELIRMIVVGVLVAIALGRVTPDFARIVYPLRVFGYTTDGNGVVTTVAPNGPNSAHPAPAGPEAPVPSGRRVRGKPLPPPKAAAPPAKGDVLLVGDRLRIDRIHPFDRKPGIVGRGYTYDNSDRYVAVERNGREQILHLVARPESPTIRFLDMVRILLFVTAIVLGAILYLMKPGIATAAFFIFCLAGVEAPATFADAFVPNPWRPLPDAAGDVLRACVRPALLLFALCLIDGDEDAPRERLFAWFAGALALGLGALNVYAGWRLNYGALPAQSIYRFLAGASVVLSVLTAAAFAIAFWRARRNQRQRIGWIVAAFLFAGVARYTSDLLYPGHIPAWINVILVSMTIVPIIVVWVAVIRHHFFNVDFVVSRAVVYAAITAGVFGVISVFEELGTYIFYQNADFAYIVFSAITLAIGMFTGKLVQVLSVLTDRFIFRDRREQRQALEFIAGYILDAENVEDVYRALLQDAAHALSLSFGGILGRQPDGSYELAQSWNWPEDFTIYLGADDDLTRAITRTRGALTFTGKDTRLIQKSFPNERLTFAAPLFFDRTVSGIVVYGHNVSGLDLDPDEREHLVRVVAHASIALNTIELNRYRNSSTPAALPLPDPLPAPATLPSPEPA